MRARSLYTLVLLSLGYFIDFYDLTIMGVSYNELIQQQFHITSTTQIQQIYLLISNFQTLGIFLGAILFGILGDKLGRAAVIKYSILLYSITTILAIYTHSLPFFIALRTLAYISLATEFATSTVLILETFPRKLAAWGTAILYSFGVLGGITATSIGFFSWQAMFMVGGVAGLILFLARSKIEESSAYLYSKNNINLNFGSIKSLLTNRNYLIILFKYCLANTPYFAVITMMFILPNYIVKHDTLAHATKILLFGFFFGNIISCIISGFIVQYAKNTKAFLYCSLILFIVLMANFKLIAEPYLFIYSIGLGLIGGGYPILLAQHLASEFPINIRNLASNSWFAIGRATSIAFNLLISSWIAMPNAFAKNAPILICAIFILAVVALSAIKPQEKLNLSLVAER